MFDSANKAAEYRKVLAILEQPKTQKRWIWLHDYDEECYRSSKSHTRNGLHWGYTECIVADVLGESPKIYAEFVTPANAKDVRFTKNGRYQKVKYRDIHCVIAKNICEDIESYDKSAQLEGKAAKEWLKTVESEFDNSKSIMNIDADEHDLLITILDPSKVVTHGSGQFIYPTNSGDVEISKGAYKLLRHMREQNGLNKFSIIPGNTTKDNKPIICGRFGFRTRINKDDCCVYPEGLDQVMALSKEVSYGKLKKSAYQEDEEDV